MESWRIENIVTLICIVTLILGLFYLSHSWHSLWGLLLLLNINGPVKRGEKDRA